MGPAPEVSGITTNSVDSDGDCRSFLTGSGCYTPGVLVQVDSSGQATGSFHDSISGDDLKYYGDRNYVMTEVPPFLAGMNYVRTSNDDKRADENDLNFLCFDVGSDATVYVLYDSRASTLPGWVAADYTDKHTAAAIHTDTNMAQGFEIYWNEVAQGNICMGGNGQRCGLELHCRGRPSGRPRCWTLNCADRKVIVCGSEGDRDCMFHWQSRIQLCIYSKK